MSTLPEDPATTLARRVAQVMREEVSIGAYDPSWPEMFNQERAHLKACLPIELVKRIEHFGSTAIPGCSGKPIIDMLVEVTSLSQTRTKIVPILEKQGYEYFWRPTWGDDIPPFYAWFIKRNQTGKRTHHIHMVEADFEHWDRLLFRDYLREHPDIVTEYGQVKEKLLRRYRHDRALYTKAKSDFIISVTERAKHYYCNRL